MPPVFVSVPTEKVDLSEQINRPAILPFGVENIRYLDYNEIVSFGDLPHGKVYLSVHA